MSLEGKPYEPDRCSCTHLRDTAIQNDNIAFDSKQDCEVNKQRVILQQRNHSPMNDTWTLKLYYGMLLQCVASDDPRMTPK